jgi:uncharacterized membrane protein
MPRTFTGWTLLLSSVIVAVALIADPGIPMPDLLTSRFNGAHALLLLGALVAARLLTRQRVMSPQATADQTHQQD